MWEIRSKYYMFFINVYLEFYESNIFAQIFGIPT